MTPSITIQKTPLLTDSMNYELLRKKGLEYIEQLGSSLWTDYNAHDPGITFLELLCYGITDLGYRTSFPVKDLIAEKPGITPDPARQALFTAREILTVNPWTSADYRKLLIDIPGIKNAWLHCKECPCDDLYLYVDCKKSELSYTYTEPDHEVIIKGLYDVMLEFEDDEGAGNLNSGKILYNFSFFNSNGDLANGVIEMRLPSWHDLDTEKRKGNVHYEAFRKATAVNKLLLSNFFISANKNESNADVPPDKMSKALRSPLFATFTVEFFTDEAKTMKEQIVFTDVPLHVWLNSDGDRGELELSVIKTALQDTTNAGILSKYLSKVKKADEAVKAAGGTLHEHRNLSEDWCRISAVETEDIAVCTDIEIEPGADMEAVVAEIYFLIDQYLAPEIKFYSLQELLQKKMPVDEIFDGPSLSNGFINNEELEQTGLKKILYASDIINLIMEVPGIKAVKNFRFTKYDDEGFVTDTQAWSMPVSYNRQPRLYVQASKITIFKNGLPFLPVRSEVNDTLHMIKGKHMQPKYAVAENDLKVPEGKWYPLTEYMPLQYQLPQTYGISYDGLPASAGVKRLAQAQQLRAYLLFFEQLLVNYLQQLSHVKELFTADHSVTQTVFSTRIDNDAIRGIEDLYQHLTSDVLQGLTETKSTYLDRRNRFLDHVMSRFAESFNEYALMLYSYSSGKETASQQLIKNKVDFIQALPFMTANRARAFNYKLPGFECSKDNVAGLKTRIERLLGFKRFQDYFILYEEKDTDGVSFERRWRMMDDNGRIYLSSSTRYNDAILSNAQQKANAEIKEVEKYITNTARYTIKKQKKWTVNLTNESGEVIATRKQPFDTKAEAEAARDEIIAFAKQALNTEKIFIVEHLLLRPHNPYMDALLPICTTPDCVFCGEEDPYSFRITVVLNGEEGIGNMVNNGIEFRRFAEHTIRAEVPAHLGVKICWVSAAQLERFETKYCAWLKELSKEQPDKTTLTTLLNVLIDEFKSLKSVYPYAALHDCEEGDDSNRVYLNQTVI